MFSNCNAHKILRRGVNFCDQDIHPHSFNKQGNMYSNTLITFLVAVFATTATSVNALPDGAPVCTIGEPAPGSLHLSPFRNPTTGSLESGGYQVSLAGQSLLDPTIPITVLANQELKVVVTSTDGVKPFRGVLLILSKQGYSTIGSFVPTNDELTKVQISDPCIEDGWGGVTHISNDLKISVEATILLDDVNHNDGLDLDVNVVEVNRFILGGGSFYYHSQYKIKVEGGNVTAPNAPSEAPTTDETGVDTCGLFGLSIFCPLTFCGFFGRLLFGSDSCL